jgi:hypothetical protein
MLAGLGMTTTGLCSLCVNCAEIAPTCDLSTGICCKLAYIGGSISGASLFIGCIGLVGCIPKSGWMESWERSRLNRLSDPGDNFPLESTPLFPEVRKEMRKEIQRTARETL